MGKENTGAKLSIGDLVFIYETKTGRPRKDRLKYKEGRQGIVALVEILDINLENGFKPLREVYSNGDESLWKMVVRTRQIDTLHFCHHDDVCDCVHYSRNNYFRGFRGLLELTEEKFECLRSQFR